MEQPTSTGSLDAWRVVIFTTIAGGIVYTLTDAVLQQFGHRVVGVMTTPGPPARRSADYLSVVGAVRPGVDVLVSTHPSRWAAMLAPLRPDLIICCGFPYRIPQAVVAMARLGAINVHPSLLPRHRGPWPLNWTFRSDDAVAGMTVHRITTAFDTGPILAQGSVPVEDEDDGDALMGKLAPLAVQLLAAALQRVAAGDPGDPQDERLATEAPFFEDAWYRVDWSQPARTVHNQVRSWTGVSGGSHGALAEIDGELVVIARTRLLPVPETSVALAPGSLIRRDDDGMIVQCGDGPIAVVAWHPVETANPD
ncbi:MAG TPA: formyltransferase family protein [Thermomicrobiales bacterium]|nr:formyltransferase family protein [Thermomicrobiales bacterium]